MELKSAEEIKKQFRAYCSNRTFMELKCYKKVMFIFALEF